MVRKDPVVPERLFPFSSYLDQLGARCETSFLKKFKIILITKACTNPILCSNLLLSLRQVQSLHSIISLSLRQDVCMVTVNEFHQTRPGNNFKPTGHLSFQQNPTAKRVKFYRQ